MIVQTLLWLLGFRLVHSKLVDHQPLLTLENGQLEIGNAFHALRLGDRLALQGILTRSLHLFAGYDVLSVGGQFLRQPLDLQLLISYGGRVLLQLSLDARQFLIQLLYALLRLL
jgi:hypothetical protein